VHSLPAQDSGLSAKYLTKELLYAPPSSTESACSRTSSQSAARWCFHGWTGAHLTPGHALNKRRPPGSTWCPRLVL